MDKKIKENIESGMYFKFKEDKYRSYTKDVYKVETNKQGFMTLGRYHCHSKTGEYIFVDIVSVRRIGENSLDYYKYDMFGKKTRGRIHYIDIDSFFYIKDNKTTIEKTA
jgi:hypothetical protein